MKEIFPLVLGNESTKKRIGRSIIEGRAPHAFLIDGAAGSGKYTLALSIAAALNCERRASDNAPLPCGECDSCRKILSGAHVDVKLLERASDKATVGVGEVKLLREDMFLSATEADYKVYIIRDAERMTPEAQNALLIVLEEPPKNVVILLLASGTDSILTTIKSRTQYIATSRFTPQELSRYLPEISEAARTLKLTNSSAFDAAIIGAEGCIGRALALTDPKSAEEAAQIRTRAIAFIRAALPAKPYTAILQALEEFPAKRQELLPQLEAVIDALRDLIALKRTDGAPTIFFTDRGEALELAKSYKLSRLFAIYDAVNRAHSDCVRNANVSSLLSSLGAQIKLLS